MVLHAPSRTFAIIEADRRAYPLAARQAAADAAKASEPEDMETDDKPAEPTAEAAAPKVTPENDPVFPYAADDAWASCVRLLDPQRGQTISCLELDPNECATCIAYCTFHDQQGEVHLVVGSALKLTLAPRTCEAGFLRVYRVTYEGLQLVHKVRRRGVSAHFRRLTRRGRVDRRNWRTRRRRCVSSRAACWPAWAARSAFTTWARRSCFASARTRCSRVPFFLWLARH